MRRDTTRDARASAVEAAADVLRPVTPSASVLLAPNPSPMTLEGTNTWLLRGGDAGEQDGYIVVDAGPADEAHLAAVAAVGTIELILLTHGHPDHSGGSARLAELTGAPVHALDRRSASRCAPGTRSAGRRHPRGDRHAGPFRGLAVVLPSGRQRGAHR